MTIKILFYSLFCFLILSTLSTNSFSQSKKLKEPLPVYKPVTSNGNELDIYKQRQDEEKAEKEKWAQYNILKDGNESYRILLNNAMKFSFPIVTIFALIIAMTSRQSKESKKSIGYEGIAISSFALVVLFVFHLFMNSNNNLDLALEYTWKLGLIIISSHSFFYCCGLKS